MGCATATIKYLVFTFNALCSLLGIGTIVVNALALKDSATETHSVLIFFIVIGSVIFLISFFGCCGVIKENVCLTWTYAISLLVLLILVCVLSFVYLKRIDEHKISEDQLNKAWEQQKNGTDAMGFWQTNLKCCGINGPVDYTKDNLIIPKSCFGNGTNTTTSNTVYPDGCLDKLTTFYTKALHLTKIFSYVLIGVEGTAFIFVSILAVTFNNEERRSRY